MVYGITTSKLSMKLRCLLDNTKYHSRYLEQIPITFWRKGNIKNGWTYTYPYHISCDKDSLKREMLYLVREHRLSNSLNVWNALLPHTKPGTNVGCLTNLKIESGTGELNQDTLFLLTITNLTMSTLILFEYYSN